MSNSRMSMSHAHHNMVAGEHNQHHGVMPQMENHKISKTDEISTLMSDPIHHHLAESAGESHTMMQMFFHGGCDEVILFDWWRISTYGGLVASMFACVGLAILYEILKVYREHVIWKRNRIQRRKQNRYHPGSTSLATNSSSDGVSPATNPHGINDSFEGDTEIDMIEDGGSGSSAVVSEQVSPLI